MTVWSEDAVKLLRAMAAKGDSAGLISRALADAGLGKFTRNAVIGKLHRLGLFATRGPAETSSGGAFARAAAARERARAAPLAESRLSRQNARTVMKGAPAAKAPARPNDADAIAARAAESKLDLKRAEKSAAALAPARRADGVFVCAGVGDLTELTCKFPIGDPREPGFAFCGREKAFGVSYCAAHRRLAFEPAGKRRRADAEARRGVKAA